MSLSAGAAAFLQTFGAVLPAELPDKSMFATVALVAHHRRPAAVWLGACSAFAFHATLAAAVGGVVARLPRQPVQLCAALVFAAGAVFMARAVLGGKGEGASLATAEEGTLSAGLEQQAGASRSAFVSSLAVLGLAELGDLTQLTIAGMAARTDATVWVGMGGWVALCCVAAAAAAGGQVLTRRLPLRRLQMAAVAVFLLLALSTLASALR